MAKVVVQNLCIFAPNPRYNPFLGQSWGFSFINNEYTKKTGFRFSLVCFCLNLES